MHSALRTRPQVGGTAAPRSRRPCCTVRASTAAAPEWTGRQFTLLSTGESATAHLARSLAGAGIQAGDAFCLKGDEKAGKGVFVREFLRAVYDAPDKEVAPPSGSLQPVVYSEHSGPVIQHLDLRGVAAPSDGEKGDLLASFEGAVSLVECAERLQEWGAAPEQRLAIWMRNVPGADGGADVRLITIVPHTGAWELRAGLLHANISRTGMPAGLVMLSDDMTASLIKDLPESQLLAVKS